MKLAIQECTWDEVRSEIYNANPALAKMIDEFNPGKEYGFIRAQYPYGTSILSGGKIHLPTDDGGVVSLDHELVPQSISKKMAYSSVPVGLVTGNAMEVYFETEQRVMPSKIFYTGTFFGLWELLDSDIKHSPSIWSISAGTRSLFMLPRISDERSHARLKKDFGISEYAPKDMLSHINVFRELGNAQRRIEGKGWNCDVLFFTNKWAEYDSNNMSQLKLRAHWLKAAWDQSLNCRNQMDYNVAWEMFSKEISRKHWKAKPYIINTIKHLIAITEGVFPGFAPALDDACAPVTFIQNAYINSYLLKDYSPIIMQSTNIRSVEKYVYYSLALPTLLEWAPRTMVSASILGDLKDLKKLIDLFMNSTKSVGFDFIYFHCEEDQLKEVNHSSHIVMEDPSMKRLEQYKNNREFSENSPFFKGCVRITKGAQTEVKVR